MRTPEEWAGVIADSGYDLMVAGDRAAMKEMVLTALRSVALAERERCAKIALGDTERFDFPWCGDVREIVAEIRREGQS